MQTKAGMLGPGTVGRIDFVVTVLSRGSANVTGHVFTGKRGHQTPLSTKILFKNLRKNEIYTVRSDPEGKYSLNQVPDGTYVVQILERGYAPFLKEIQVHGHTTQNFHLINRRIASAEINAVGNSTVRDSTGAITVVGRKNFADNPSTGLGYVLEQTPSVQYYSRSGANGLTGG